MTEVDLRQAYRRYLACLDARDWPRLGEFVADDVVHNDRPLGLAGYRAMLEQDVREIPDLRFDAEFIVVEGPRLAARLRFDCAPAGTFLGLPVDGRRVSFAENVFYEFHDGRIAGVWSVIDKAAIEAQLVAVAGPRIRPGARGRSRCTRCRAPRNRRRFLGVPVPAA